MRISLIDEMENCSKEEEEPCSCEEFHEAALKRSPGESPKCEAYTTRGLGFFACTRATTSALVLTESTVRHTFCEEHRKKFSAHGSCAHCRRFFQKGLTVVCSRDSSHVTHLGCARKFSPKKEELICSHCNAKMEEEVKWIDTKGLEKKNQLEEEGEEAVIKRALDYATELPPGWLDGSYLSSLISSGSSSLVRAARSVGVAVSADHLCQLADLPSNSAVDVDSLGINQRNAVLQVFDALLLCPEFDYFLAKKRDEDGNTAVALAARKENWELIVRLLKHFDYRSVDVEMQTGLDAKSLRQLCEHAPKNVQDAIGYAGMINRYSALYKKVMHEDLSRGTERFPIRVVNDVDDERPVAFVYSTRVVDRCGVLRNRKSGETLICNCRDGCEVDCECNSGVYDERGIAKLSMLEAPFLECSSDCLCNMACGNRVAQKGATQPIEVFRTSDVRGWGVRALCRIPKGSFIGEYTGELLTDAEANRRIDSYLFETSVGDSNYTVDARLVGNFTRFINHSCEPNSKVCMVVWDWQTEQLSHICIFAVRDIFKGEEITISYGEHWWRAKILEFPCLCGEKKCQFTPSKRTAILRKKQQESETISLATTVSSASSYDSESSL